MCRFNVPCVFMFLISIELIICFSWQLPSLAVLFKYEFLVYKCVIMLIKGGCLAIFRRYFCCC